MKWLPDYTRRFAQYPYYEESELDLECQQLVLSFIRKRHSTVSFPLSTDDLSVLVESLTSDLDWCADLSDYGEDVEGITHFKVGDKPRVEISKDLSGSSMSNRFRMTLAHELVHVRFHNCLYQLPDEQCSLFTTSSARPLHCKREAIAGATKKDWMEWQAAYGGGAILMPRDSIKATVAKAYPKTTVAFHPESDEARHLTTIVSEHFEVSRLAARVRLEKLGVLSRSPQLNFK